jgi:ribosomal-protein-alanine N-acetyltransferase
MLQLDLSTFPLLTTARLHLRAIALTDAPELFFLRSDPGMLTYLDKAPATSLEEVEQFIKTLKENEAACNGVTWVITQNGSDTLIGTIGYWWLLKEHYRAEIGYALHPAHQGKGLMREAMDAVLGYGFGPMGLHSVEANVNPANAASIRLLERAGFVREGYFRENYYYDGRFLDSAIYSLLVQKWHNRPV